MFKKTRRKIVLTIMAILVLIWVGTLGFIYISSYFEMSDRNERMLQEHVEMYTNEQKIEPFKPEMPLRDNNMRDYYNTPRFKLSTFYSVTFSKDGTVLEIHNNKNSVYTDKALEDIAKDIFKSNNDTGVKSNLTYRKADKGDYVLVAFIDNTIFNENMSTVFRYILIFGGVALIALYFISAFIAKKIVKPLEENHQKQKQFISDAGHELKTPISVISANSDLLAREIGENKWLNNIQYENERMATLVKQLLELAKNESITYKDELIDFSRLVAGELLPFESIAFEKGLNINAVLNDNIYIKGNTDRLRQLIAILLDNALEHNKDVNEIEIRLTKERNLARLSVINGGNAITKEEQKHLFERFYRTDASRNGEGGHYGLGLSIAQAIVKAHGGKIDVLCYNNLIEFKIFIPLQ